MVPINATDNPRHNAVLVGIANLQRSDNRNDAFALQYDHTFGGFADLTFQASRMSTTNDGVLGSTYGYKQDPMLVAAGLYSVALWSRNLFNKLYATNINYDNDYPALTPQQSAYAYVDETFGPPRTFGVQMQANF